MRLYLDIETYPNYFLAQFMSEDRRVASFELSDYHELDYRKLARLIEADGVELVTFNGLNYDLPMLTAALMGMTNAELKDESDHIIENGERSWQFYRRHDVQELAVNHIDLIEVAPGVMTSLKIYGGRLHCPKLQDLPYEPDMVLSREQMAEVKKYCRNDLLTTQALAQAVQKPIELREQMSLEYSMDLRSKSDAQIAEAVLKTEYTKRTGDRPERMEVLTKSIKYDPPSYIKFLTPDLQQALSVICNADMTLDPSSGHVKMPKEVEQLRIVIGTTTYKVGIGGLHSQESRQTVYASDTHDLLDMDVTSYYPNLIVNTGMSPSAFGEHFNPVYKHILEERVAAKRSGDKSKADSLKTVANSAFGKMANKYSTLYAPDLMLRTTLTGQLSLLMLIEMLESFSIPVISANTDGVVIHCPVAKRPALAKICAAWQKRTGLNLEDTHYRSIHSRDVNNYIAITTDGDAKTKGIFAAPGLMKNPQNTICREAVIDYLKHGTPLEETIRSCDDIRQFVTLRTVKGGAVKDDEYLGKVVRWYYSRNVTGVIRYKSNGNTVPRSEGAMPVLNLPDELPDDIDYVWYEVEAAKMLVETGAVQEPDLGKVPRKNSAAWKEAVANGTIRQASNGKWEWSQHVQQQALSVVL